MSISIHPQRTSAVHRSTATPCAASIGASDATRLVTAIMQREGKDLSLVKFTAACAGRLTGVGQAAFKEQVRGNVGPVLNRWIGRLDGMVVQAAALFRDA